MSDKFNDKYRIKSARLEGYDYRNEGLYFVTICTKHRTHYFGECNGGIMLLNNLGKKGRRLLVSDSLIFSKCFVR